MYNVRIIRNSWKIYRPARNLVVVLFRVGRIHSTLCCLKCVWRFEERNVAATTVVTNTRTFNAIKCTALQRDRVMFPSYFNQTTKYTISPTTTATRFRVVRPAGTNWRAKARNWNRKDELHQRSYQQLAAVVEHGRGYMMYKATIVPPSTGYGSSKLIHNTKQLQYSRPDIDLPSIAREYHT